MNLEKVFSELNNILYKNKEKNSYEVDTLALLELMEKIEKQVRKEVCYKTTSKTRVDAIKRVASKDNARPVLQGYGVSGDYKLVTDSYHAIAIKEENMPIPRVAGDMSLEEAHKWMDEHGRNSLINGTYPNMSHFINLDNINKENQLTIDVNDLSSFIKLHPDYKKEGGLYKVGESYYNPKFIKNIIDIIGKDAKIYYQGEYKPLYFVNDKDEIGLVLPIKNY